MTGRRVCCLWVVLLVQLGVLGWSLARFGFGGGSGLPVPTGGSMRPATDPFYLQNLTIDPGSTSQRPGGVAAKLGPNAVPFYVYEDDIFVQFQCFKKADRMAKEMLGELYWLSAIEKHPWRVLDPDDATIFVVPICPACLNNRQCRSSRRKALTDVSQYLESNKYFQRHGGYDHLTVSIDYRLSGPKSWRGGERLWNFTHAHYGYFPDAPYRCPLPASCTVNPHIQTMMRERLRKYQKTTSWKPRVPGADPPDEIYDSIKADGDPPRIVPWSDRRYNLFFMGTVNRPPKPRRVAMTSLPGNFSPSVFISSDLKGYKPCDFDAENGLEGCSISGKDWSAFAHLISNTKYNLHMEGDDYTSSRIADAIAAGTPTIMVSNKLWTRGLPNSCQLPWRKLAIQVHPSDFLSSPVKSIKEALVAAEGGGQVSRFLGLFGIGPQLPTSPLNMVELLDRHAPDMLWEAPNSRVASNLLTNAARRCLPPQLLEAQGYARHHFRCEFPDLYDPTVFDDRPHS